MATTEERGTSKDRYVPSPSPSPTPDPCTRPRSYYTSSEQSDWNELACPRGFNETMEYSCVAWPASFYWLDTSKKTRVDEAERRPTNPKRFEDWLADQCQIASFVDGGTTKQFVVNVDKTGPDISWTKIRTMLKPGHVVHFHGQPPPWASAGSLDTRHYAIATGRGDEVSQKWYSRAQRQRLMDKIKEDLSAHRHDQPAPPGLQDPEPEYPIHRDGLEVLVKACTLATGERYLVNRFTIYEVKDTALMMERDVALLTSH